MRNGRLGGHVALYCSVNLKKVKHHLTSCNVKRIVRKCHVYIPISMQEIVHKLQEILKKIHIFRVLLSFARFSPAISPHVLWTIRVVQGFFFISSTLLNLWRNISTVRLIGPLQRNFKMERGLTKEIKRAQWCYQREGSHSVCQNWIYASIEKIDERSYSANITTDFIYILDFWGRENISISQSLFSWKALSIVCKAWWFNSSLHAAINSVGITGILVAVFRVVFS